MTTKPILDAEVAYAFSDLSTHCWRAIAERDRMERSWQYHWERKDTSLFNKAKEAGQVVVVQSQTANRLVAYGKLVAR